MKTLACLVTVAFLSFGATTAFAQNPSAKFAAQATDLKVVEENNLDWKTVLETTIKTPNKKDLLIGASFQTGLFTRTQVKGKNGSTDSSTAKATLKVKVLVDEKAAYPGEVVYDSREQILSATLGGVIESCQDGSDGSVPDGIINVPTECVVTDEMIELLLDTMAAHHYNFVVANLGPGTHKVKVQVKVDTTNDTTSTRAVASWGPGSLTVEEVRATNSPDGITFE
jgi:hypothetical protein